MDMNAQPDAAYKCPECSGTLSALYDWQRQNLLTHMIRREPTVKAESPTESTA